MTDTIGTRNLFGTDADPKLTNLQFYEQEDKLGC